MREKKGEYVTILRLDFSFPVLYIGFMKIKMANLKGQPWVLGIGGEDERVTNKKKCGNVSFVFSPGFFGCFHCCKAVCK
jgi:hypothetical protein